MFYSVDTLQKLFIQVKPNDDPKSKHGSYLFSILNFIIQVWFSL